ncbi:MAG TPA: hypothetical protein VM580_35325 [Labilithrix sp.]|nr:hypothetical protein [Labilithrix sp.]
MCVTAGEAPMGHPCTGTEDCATGLTCIFGICHAFCNDPTKPCSQANTGVCDQIKTTDGDDIPNLAICRVACEPHDPSSCGGKTSAGTGVCRVLATGDTECQAEGERAEGDACSPEDDCGPGLVCVTTDSTSSCKRWCRVGKTDCASGSTCRAFANDIIVRGVLYGSCS